MHQWNVPEREQSRAETPADHECESVAALARELTVRDGKGGKDRLTLLPESLVPALQVHLFRVRSLRQSDLVAGWGRVLMPCALARKYPNANREWCWQWVFPQPNRWRDRASGTQGRHHLDPSVVQKAVKRAVAGAGVTKQASCHTFRHSLATHLLERPGHSHHPGAAGPQGCEYDHDLYPRAQSRPFRDTKLRRPFVAARTVGLRTRKPCLPRTSPYSDSYAVPCLCGGCWTQMGGGSRKTPRVRPWFSEPANKEFGVYFAEYPQAELMLNQPLNLQHLTRK
jgi:hypothetical protein